MSYQNINKKTIELKDITITAKSTAATTQKWREKPSIHSFIHSFIRQNGLLILVIDTV